MRRIIPLLVLAAVVGADEVEQLSPKSAWQKMEQDVKAARKARDFEAFTEARNRPKKFLAAWEKSGSQATGEDLVYLGRFQNAGEQPVAAMKSLFAAAHDKSLSDELRTQAKVFYSSAMVGAMSGGKLDDKAADEAIKVAQGFALSAVLVQTHRTAVIHGGRVGPFARQDIAGRGDQGRPELRSVRHRGWSARIDRHVDRPRPEPARAL